MPAPAEPPFAVAPDKDPGVKGWMEGLGTLDTPAQPATPPAEPPNEPPAEPAATPTPSPTPEPKPAEPAKPAAPPADKAEPQEPPPDKWPRTAQEWKKFMVARDEGYKKRETERDQIKAELEQTRKEIESLRKEGPSSELEQLKKERDELSDKLRLVDVQQHPKFKAYFDNKIGAQLDLAKRIVAPENAEKIVALLKLPDSQYRTEQISALSADMTPFDQARLANIVNSLEQINGEREAEVSKARENYDKIQAEKDQKSKANIESAQKAFNDMVKAAQKDNPIFQLRDGDEAWNKGVAQRVEQARTLLFGQPPPDMVLKAAMAATALPVVLQGYQGLQEENKKLAAQVKELSAAQPKIEGAGTTATAGSPVPVRMKPGSGYNPGQAAQAWIDYVTAPID